ncbi:shikimate kinase [Dethiothermospora halolimnae]|uniref:shikimate kinase n=1 Tax=Dethiothermospora halolimnae TaxID=3114390 RepID=UPI003CCC1E4A
MRKNIVLTGFMASGKSTVAKVLSKKLKIRYIDIDRYIERKENMSIKTIFNKFGEKHFRELESKAVNKISKQRNVIISTGGGVILNNKNIKSLKKRGKIFLLDASPKTVIKNLKNSRRKRPLLSTRNWEGRVYDLMNNRKNLYKKSCDYVISVDGKSINEICNEILEINNISL